MSDTAYDEDQLVHVARERIRREGHACIVSIEDLLHELSEQFGDRFFLSDTVYNVLELIHTLSEDPHIDLVTDMGFIWFVWNEQGRVGS